MRLLQVQFSKEDMFFDELLLCSAAPAADLFYTKDDGEEVEISAALKRFVVHRSAAVMATVTRGHLRFWTFVTAAVVFLLLVTPVSLTTTFSILNANSH